MRIHKPSYADPSSVLEMWLSFSFIGFVSFLLHRLCNCSVSFRLFVVVVLQWMSYYLCQGGHSFIAFSCLSICPSVCLSFCPYVSRIAHKIFDWGWPWVKKGSIRFAVICVLVVYVIGIFPGNVIDDHFPENFFNNNNNNNNSNNLNNLYGAITWTQPIQGRCTLGSSDECRGAPSGCQPSDQANQLELWPCL